ncbi:MAG TPA: ATP-dependent Clp protease ATP-binding subunit [bacterium]|nr:ATP-dependent Clp protease ATP-binding subunit [bacterium]
MHTKFTAHLQNVLERAEHLAGLKFKKHIEPEDVLFSLVQERGALAREVLVKAGLKLEILEVKKEAKKNSKNLVWDLETKKILEKSAVYAMASESKYVGTEHVLYALVSSASKKVQDFLVSNKVKADKLIEHLEVVLKTGKNFSDIAVFIENNQIDWEKMLGGAMNKMENNVDDNFFDSEALIKKQPLSRLDARLVENKKNQRSFLDFFARNLTDKKVQQTIDPVIGRENEINRIIQILARRTKNNPVLLGDAGVGKTAIVDGLAKKITESDVPDILLNKKIYALDMNMLLAGAMMRGEFEGRLKQVLDEVRQDPNIILFIDEIHTIVGAGAVTGAMDAANVLKPALARGEIRCIGATTYEDYKKYIEEDPALERRFQPVSVNEPSVEETIEILKGIKKNYEQHHLVKISLSAIEAAARLSARHITERFLPDKAIDLIDEAAARVKVRQPNSPFLSEVRFLEEKMMSLEEKKMQAITDENYPLALDFKKEEEKILDKIAIAKSLVENKPAKWLGEITDQDIAQVMSEIKKIPVAELSLAEGKNLVNLEKKLNNFIFGQEVAMAEIAFFIKRARAGLSSDVRPTGSFIFLGPSGVGKTETAKVLAREVFGAADKLIRIDMSEFAEGFNISRLIGSPPGYIGFKEGGKLTESIKRQPYSVVLFDEMEKAHPQVFNILLQILEDGVLTDAAGKKVSFKNALIIMTANLGMQNLGTKNFGFDSGFSTQNEKQKKITVFKDAANDALKREFRPELLSRVDKVVFFQPLGLETLVAITKSYLEQLAVRLEPKRINFSASPKITSWLAKKSLVEEGGAREVRRVVEREVENPLTDKILLGEIKSGTSIKIDLYKNSLVFKISD